MLREAEGNEAHGDVTANPAPYPSLFPRIPSSTSSVGSVGWLRDQSNSARSPVDNTESQVHFCLFVLDFCIQTWCMNTGIAHAQKCTQTFTQVLRSVLYVCVCCVSVLARVRARACRVRVWLLIDANEHHLYPKERGARTSKVARGRL
jgi:hypothetical protein